MNFAITAMSSGASAGAMAPAGGGDVEHKKLVNAAQEFEGMLLQEMLKPMREHGFAQEESESKDDSGFGDTLSSFGTEQMATAIAKGGGLGIAKKVVTQVEAERAAHAGAAP